MLRSGLLRSGLFLSGRKDPAGRANCWPARCSALFLAALFGHAAAAELAAQELRLLLPTGATRGQRAKVTCYGRNLNDTIGVIWMREGITVQTLDATRSDRVVMTLDIPSDCELGTYLFALHTKRGMTRPKGFRVGALPSIRERRALAKGRNAHGTRATAQRIALDLTVDGRILPEESDWYAFECRTGQIVRIDVEAIRLGLTDLDLELEVFDPKGQRVLRSDDTALGRADPGAWFEPKTTGTYTLCLSDIARRGSAAGAYRLHLGTYPRPVGLLPAGGKPGERIEVELLGGATRHRASLQLPDLVGLHEVFPVVDGRASATPVHVSVHGHECFVEGDLPKEPPTAPIAFHGVIGKNGEEDRFAFRAKKGQRILIRALANNLRSPLDPLLLVRDQAGKTLQANDDASGLDGRLRFTAPANGVYHACVRDHLRRGGATFFYRVEVGSVPVSPGTNEAVPGRRAEDFGVSVPQGRRNATIVQANGIDPRKANELTFQHGPDGLHAERIRVPKGTSLVPMVFRAEPRAPLAAAGMTPALFCDDDPKQRSMRHLHRFPILRVRNNEPYALRAVRKMPVAITAPVPFDLQAASPGVPIVRSGTLTLPVKVPRDLLPVTGKGKKKGKDQAAKPFAGTVTVSALWLPAGVSASTLRLTGGKTSGTITLNANSRAAIGEWPMVLRASASFDGVARTISTEVLKLHVAEPWITAKLPRSRIDQGSEGTFAIELEHKHAWQGKVTTELGRIPRSVSYDVPTITKDSKKLAIKLRAAKNARPGRHRSIYMRIKIATENGVVTHVVGGGELRVDRPLPTAKTKPAAPKPTPAKPAQANPDLAKPKLAKPTPTKPTGARQSP